MSVRAADQESTKELESEEQKKGEDKSWLHASEMSANKLTKLQDQEEILAKVKFEPEGKTSTAVTGLFKWDFF